MTTKNYPNYFLDFFLLFFNFNSFILVKFVQKWSMQQKNMLRIQLRSIEWEKRWRIQLPLTPYQVVSCSRTSIHTTAAVIGSSYPRRFSADAWCRTCRKGGSVAARFQAKTQPNCAGTRWIASIIESVRLWSGSRSISPVGWVGCRSMYWKSMLGSWLLFAIRLPFPRGSTWAPPWVRL